MTTNNRKHTPSLLARVRSRRAASASRRQLAAELATFTSPAELLELDTILDSADERDAEYVRSVLIESRSRQAA